MKRLCLGVVVAAGLTLPAFGQEAIKPPDGYYVLNLAKSAMRGIAPKAEALKLEGDMMTIINFGADGKARTFVADTIIDGKPHPITNSPLFDTQTATQLDPYTVGVTRTKEGKGDPNRLRYVQPDNQHNNGHPHRH